MKIKTRKSRFWRWALKRFFPAAEYEKTWLTFGQTIWTPGSITVDLIAHEAVHGQQQKNWWHAIWWWKRYIKDPAFRYSQEKPAYKAQYELIARGVPDRNKRFKIRCDIAKIMSSEQYKGMVDFNQALQDLSK